MPYKGRLHGVLVARAKRKPSPALRRHEFQSLGNASQGRAAKIGEEDVPVGVPLSSVALRLRSVDAQVTQQLVTVGMRGVAPGCSRTATAVTRACARHIGAASERENV
jgi:hypothetical protein